MKAQNKVRSYGFISAGLAHRVALELVKNKNWDVSWTGRVPTRVWTDAGSTTMNWVSELSFRGPKGDWRTAQQWAEVPDVVSSKKGIRGPTVRRNPRP